jgi:hypothetical protein
VLLVCHSKLWLLFYLFSVRNFALKLNFVKWKYNLLMFREMEHVWLIVLIVSL